MKNQYLKGFSMMVAGAIALVACKPTDWSKVTYEVTPNPLEMHGDTLVVTAKGVIPPKTFAKGNSATFTPMIKWAGGEKALKTISFDGEKIKGGKGTLVKKATGTSFNYSDKVAYEPGMKVSELVGKATITNKKGKVKKEYTTPKLADATVVTPLWIMSDEKALLGKDQMPKVIPMGFDAEINFLMSQADVRGAETNKQAVKEMIAFIKNSQTDILEGKKVVGKKENYTIKGVSISSYASPDGEQDKNANLATDRGKSSAKYLVGEFKKMKMEAGTQENFYSQTSTAEDWDGFKTLMEASTVPDKEMIVRILTTYSDLDKRESEIKNISKAYTEISDQILPKLRRSKVHVTAEKLCKTDDLLRTMSAATPDSLNVEELLYSSTLTNDMNTQMTIFNNVARIYPNDWRGPNNAGVLYLNQNKIADAQAQFEKADKLSANNAIVKNNLGIIAIKKGDRAAALALYGSATSAGPEVAYNTANIQVMQGKYSEAVSNYGSYNTFNSALGKVLNKVNDAASASIEASQDKDSGMGFYLKAIISARKGDAAGVLSNLKSVTAKDASLGKKAKEDMEFVKWFENADFKAL
jgi:tetratricopeptide (TPR) repeat protein